MLNPSDPAPSSARRRWRASGARIRRDEKFFSTTSGGSTSAGAGAGVPDGSVSDGTRPAGAGAAGRPRRWRRSLRRRRLPAGRRRWKGGAERAGRATTREFSCLRGISGAAAKETGMPLPSRAAPCIAEMRWRSTPSSGWSGRTPPRAPSPPPQCERCRLHLSLFLVRGPELLQVGGGKRALASPDTSFSTEYAYMVARSAISAGPGSRVGAERVACLYREIASSSMPSAE